jgi:hypothetical protein
MHPERSNLTCWWTRRTEEIFIVKAEGACISLTGHASLFDNRGMIVAVIACLVGMPTAHVSPKRRWADREIVEVTTSCPKNLGASYLQK